MRFKNRLFSTIVVLTFTFLAIGPISATYAEEPTAEQEILDVVHAYLKTMEQSYFGEFEAIDANIVTDDAILNQINGQNRYVGNRQKVYTIESASIGFTTKDMHVFDGQAKLLVNLKLDQQLRKDDALFPFVMNENFALELREVDDAWQIHRVLPQKGAGNDTFADFQHHLAIEDELVALSPAERAEQVIIDFAGIDYAKEDTNDTPSIPKDITVMWNNTMLTFPDQQPIIRNDRVLVPIRPLVEKLEGYGIVEMRPVPYTFSVLPLPNPNSPENVNKKSFTFTIGDDAYAYTDPALNISENRALPARLEVINGRTMLPVRTIGEAFGHVSWEETTRSVHITTS